MARRAGSVHLDLPVDVQAGLLVDRSVGVDGPRMAGVAVGPLRVRRGWRRSVARGAPRPAGVGPHERQGIGALEPTAVTPCIATCRGGAIPRRLESARPRQGSELERGLAAALVARRLRPPTVAGRLLYGPAGFDGTGWQSAHDSPARTVPAPRCALCAPAPRAVE